MSISVNKLSFDKLNNRIFSMSPKQVVSSFHKDLFSKVSISLTTFIAIGICTTMYGVLRPSIVTAADLNASLSPIQASIAEIRETNKELKRSVDNQTVLIQQLSENQIEIRIDYLEDQIRILASKPRLTNEEKYRIRRYTDDLEREKLKRGH